MVDFKILKEGQFLKQRFIWGSRQSRPIEIKQDFSICRDQLLKLVEIILTFETRFFFFLVKIFQSRLSCIEIFIKINQDCQDFSRLWILFKIVKIYQDFLTFLRDFTNRHLWINLTFHSKMDQK